MTTARLHYLDNLLIVPLQMAALEVPVVSLAKFALVTLVVAAVVFAWSQLLRLLPPVRAVL